MGRPRAAETQTPDAADRLLDAAARGFRAGGYAGSGVDGLAKLAGLTSGAFYALFRSKSDAFREAVRVGLEELRDGVRRMREAGGEDWRKVFIDFYLTERRTCDLAQSCALQSLSPDVMRADAGTRRVYEAGLSSVVDELAGAGEDRAQAIALLALLSGGVTMARAVEDPAAAEKIASAVRAAAYALTAA